MNEDSPDDAAEDVPPMDEPTPVKGLGGVADYWDDIVADMETTAEEYRERDWETLELHPGQVWPQFDTGAFDVLLPDSEYEALVEFVDGGDVDDYDVFRAEVSMVFFLLVMRDEERRRAVFVPGYYDFGHGKKLYYGLDGDSLGVSVRRLREDGRVEFSLDRPEPFFPEEVREAKLEE
ncbi:DUF7529 family protein [Halomarina oriensis]|uniref:Uncharacterized protein n=1 Tax=Halomarina oriensis TaxID=671145 RepID=A0A6B0GW25_9EURY|nr:hypothetical protein [Halomarina oriensis]MWG35938.1 hypothetical protein [Halomarina oriensis]